MDRVITNVGESVYEWLFSKPDQNTMVGLAKLSVAMLGSSTVCNGLGCVPTSPASMQVQIQAGEIYSLANLEASVCGTLPADSTHQIVKQGLNLDVYTSASGALAAPGTAGQSIAYLIEAQYADSDISIDPTTGNTPVVLQFYNSSNPLTPYSGPNGGGATSTTFRKGIVSLQIKAGAAATTGSQITPTPDAGWVGLWVVTVANGQSTITAGNITQYAGAPILPSSLLASIQNGNLSYAVATGTANAHTVALTPALTARVDGMVIRYKAPAANTGALTLNDGIGTVSVVGGAHAALQGGETVQNGDVWVQWNSSIGGGSYIMLDSSGGALQVAPATQSQHALQLGQAKGRLLNVQKFTTHGTFPYTPTAGTTAAYAECQGAGASGGGTPATGAGQVAVGGGGAAGSFGSSWFPTGIASGTTITVGQGGAAVANANNPGGTSSIGALLSAPGGGGGSIAGPTTPPWVTGGGNTGGSASGANLIAARGQSGEASIAINSSNAGYGGAGGPSVYGGGGSQAAAGANGSAGVSPGSGGGGCFAGASTVQLIGGAGADGCVLIYEYGTA